MARSLLVIGAVVLATSGVLYVGSLGDEPRSISNAAAKADFGVFPVKSAGTAELDSSAEAAAIRASFAGTGTTGMIDSRDDRRMRRGDRGLTMPRWLPVSC